MPFLRMRLRLLAVVWLCCQSLAAAASLPANCCSPQAAAHDAGDVCDAADGECPMHSAGDVECPLHAATASAREQSSGNALHRALREQDACVMTSLCKHSSSELATLLSMPGIITGQVSAEDTAVAAVVMAPAPLRHDLVTSSDTPPPRL